MAEKRYGLEQLTAEEVQGSPGFSKHVAEMFKYRDPHTRTYLYPEHEYHKGINSGNIRNFGDQTLDKGAMYDPNKLLPPKVYYGEGRNTILSVEDPENMSGNKSFKFLPENIQKSIRDNRLKQIEGLGSSDIMEILLNRIPSREDLHDYGDAYEPMLWLEDMISHNLRAKKDKKTKKSDPLKILQEIFAEDFRHGDYGLDI